MQFASRLKAGMLIAGAVDDETERSGDLSDLWHPIFGPQIPFFGVDEVSRIMRVSPSTVRLMVRDGRLKGYHFGGRVIVDAPSVRSALEPIEPSSEQIQDDSSAHSPETSADSDSSAR